MLELGRVGERKEDGIFQVVWAFGFPYTLFPLPQSLVSSASFGFPRYKILRNIGTFYPFSSGPRDFGSPVFPFGIPSSVPPPPFCFFPFPFLVFSSVSLPTTGSLRKPLREGHVGRHQTIALMNKTMKLHLQNTIWLVSPPSSAKQRVNQHFPSFVLNVVVRR